MWGTCRRFVNIVKTRNRSTTVTTDSEETSDSPADFIRRWNIIGCGVHLGNDDVGIIRELQSRRQKVSELLDASEDLLPRVPHLLS